MTLQRNPRPVPRIRSLLIALMVLPFAALAAGCVDSPAAPTGDAGPADAVAYAPWWIVGRWWDIQITRGTDAPETVRLVNFLNQSNHFWLGVKDRGVAMDMALHSNNPLLGRIHWGILTPHENGIHAHGMFTFPVQPGDEFGGIAFGHQWEITASNGSKPGALSFQGKSTDKVTMTYDWDPEVQWFSQVRITSRSGAPLLSLEVKDHGDDATGTYHFLRGRDYYDDPTGSGTHEESFTVKAEEKEHKSLALEFRGRATGPLRVDVIDPSGTTRFTETLPTSATTRIVEIPTPALGDWKLRFIGTGDFEGTILGVGILEYAATLG